MPGTIAKRAANILKVNAMSRFVILEVGQYHSYRLLQGLSSTL